MVKHFSSFCLIFCLFLPLMLKADFERAVRPLRNGTLVLRRASWCWTSTALIRTQQHRSRKSPSEPDSGRRQRRNIWYPDGSICRFYEGTVIMPAAAVSHSRFSIRSVFIRRSVSFAIAPGESGQPSESQSPSMLKNAAMKYFLTFLAMFFYLLLTFLKKYVIIYKDESGIPPLDAKVAGTTPRQHEKGHYNNMK